MAPTPTASRRQSRRAAFVLLYQMDVLAADPETVASRYAAGAGQPVPAYAREALDGASASREELDAQIDGAADGWTADRLGAVERAILRLALWEIEHRPDVPVEVSIDEAVELAKRYASPAAAGFVNGVLGRVARERRESGEGT
jgi:N utilization substance protein B